MSLLRAAFVLAATCSVVLALAQSPVGTWNGRMKLVTSSKQTSQEKMRMSGMAGVLAKMHTTLTLKANHTFTATTSGIKGEAGSLKQQGKWSQAGNTVTLTDPDKPGRSQKFVMSKGGKEMTLSMGGVNIVLTR